MQLTVKVHTLGNQTGVLNVSENDFVESVISKLEKRYGIPAAQQRVLYEGLDGRCSDLHRGRKLKEYNLAHHVRFILAKALPAKPKGSAPDYSAEWQPSRRRAKVGFVFLHVPPFIAKGEPFATPSSEACADIQRGNAWFDRIREPHSYFWQVQEAMRFPRLLHLPIGLFRVPTKSPEAESSDHAAVPLLVAADYRLWCLHAEGTFRLAFGGAARIISRGEGGDSRSSTCVVLSILGHSGSVSLLASHGYVAAIYSGLVDLESALKAVSKGYLAHLRMEYSVLNEKRILKMLDTPFVVRLLATYSGREHVYFLLEAALGGELFTTYERLKLYGSEEHARFYVACVTEALTHLHEKHVIYRDLKPENLLLDVRGFCKVTDMGLAKITTNATFTMVGTPDYMAPEVIEQSGHTKSVDWWTLGVLLFELLAGHAPFESKSGNAQETYALVKKGIETVRFPDSVKSEAGALVRNLCHRNPDVRLRTPQLRDHSFFRGFNWKGLQNLQINPPLVPQVRGPRDLTNFRDCEHEDPQAMPYQDTGSGWDIGFEDDVLSVGATAAAAAAPMLSLPTCGATPSGTPQRVPAAASNASSPGYRAAPLGTSPQAPQAAHPQQRRLLSPPCSPRGTAQRPQTARVQGGVANAARNAWQAHADRKMAAGAGSFVPPIIRSGGGLQSPPSSPVMGGGDSKVMSS
ncbi:PRKG1 [Symbiodinium pilosum]|uniref:PRKG1 protein n=1 Tax=Symbiodinium pilosum TaxID=2952 RepID=A0A812XQB9_SYMPI|nr:PRKG1 [Symbiodinium pilosum]